MNLKRKIKNLFKYLSLPRTITRNCFPSSSSESIIKKSSHVNENFTIRPNAIFSEQRKIIDFIARSSGNLILTTYFTSKANPQTNQIEDKNNFLYIKAWYESVNKIKINAVIFHDGLDNYFTEELENDNIIFLKVPLGNMSLNDERFFVYIRFIQEFKSNLNKIILTDINDVIFLLNPFDFISDNKLYFGIDSAQNIIKSKYLLGKFKEFILKTNLFVNKKFLFSPVLNAGVIGGKIEILLSFLNNLESVFNKIENDPGNYNMIVVNYVAYIQKISRFDYPYLIRLYPPDVINSKLLFAGYPFVSKFKKFESPAGVYIKHK